MSATKSEELKKKVKALLLAKKAKNQSSQDGALDAIHIHPASCNHDEHQKISQNTVGAQSTAEEDDHEEPSARTDGVTKSIKKGLKKKPEKVFFLSVEQLEEKKDKLVQKLETLTGPENKKKRANTFQLLAHVKKALENPEVYVRDASQETMKLKLDKMKRINKKLSKKKSAIDEKRKERNKLRNVQCLACKKYGHALKDCEEKKETKTDVCYNCGSPDHGLYDCPQPRERSLKFASCFVCNEIGHLSRDCPKNENGMYYKGGGCYFCGGKDHIKLDCPEWAKRKERNNEDKHQEWMERKQRREERVKNTQQDEI